VVFSDLFTDEEVGLGFLAATDALVGARTLAAADIVIAASLKPVAADANSPAGTGIIGCPESPVVTKGAISAGNLPAPDCVIGTCYTTAAGSVRSPRWPGCDGVTGQLDDVCIGECFVLHGAENKGGPVIAYSVLHHHNDGDIATEGCVASCDYRGRLCRSGDGLLCSDGVLAMGATTTDHDELDCVHGDDTKICWLAEDCVGGRLERHEARLVYSTTAEIVGLTIFSDCVSYSDGVEAADATTDCDELGRTHGDDAKICELADDRIGGRLGHHRARLAYSAMEESMMTELGAPVVGLRALIVEVTNSTGFWDGGERRYPSVSWETYVLYMLICLGACTKYTTTRGTSFTG